MSDLLIAVFVGAPEAPVIRPEPDTQVTSISVSLVWVSGYNGAADQTFTVQYRKVSSDVYTRDEKMINDPGNGKTATKCIKNLKEETAYEFVVAAHNLHGTSNSKAAVFTTKGRCL